MRSVVIFHTADVNLCGLVDSRTIANKLPAMTRGEHLACAISHALTGAATIVRGMWRTLTDQERRAVASHAVDRLKEHGDKWKLNEEEPTKPLEGAHSTPQSFTEAHNKTSE